jgi:hypothetical protein
VQQEQRRSTRWSCRVFERLGGEPDGQHTTERIHLCSAEDWTQVDKSGAGQDIDRITRHLRFVPPIVRGVTGALSVMRRRNEVHIGRQLTNVAQHDEQGQKGQQPPGG